MVMCKSKDLLPALFSSKQCCCLSHPVCPDGYWRISFRWLYITSGHVDWFVWLPVLLTFFSSRFSLMPTAFGWKTSRLASTPRPPESPSGSRLCTRCASAPAARPTFLQLRAFPPARPWAASAFGADLRAACRDGEQNPSIGSAIWDYWSGDGKLQAPSCQCS